MEQTIHIVSFLSCISLLMNLHPENSEDSSTLFIIWGALVKMLSRNPLFGHLWGTRVAYVSTQLRVAPWGSRFTLKPLPETRPGDWVA